MPTGRPQRSNRVVDATVPPYIRALAIDPKDGSFRLATNTGLYRIGADGRRLTRLASRVVMRGATGPYGRKVSAFAATGPGRLIGSGHPDRAGKLPGFLGVMRSADGGLTWTPMARVGLSDLHVITITNTGVYAFDTVLGGVITSADGGRTFSERSAPPGYVLDLAVDPRDSNYLLATTAETIFSSADGGRSWRALARAPHASIAWTGGDPVRADLDGRVRTSADRGQTWAAIGRLADSPGKLVGLAGGALYAALVDGSIQVSRDGGHNWRTVFSP